MGREWATMRGRDAGVCSRHRPADTRVDTGLAYPGAIWDGDGTREAVGCEGGRRTAPVDAHAGDGTIAGTPPRAARDHASPGRSNAGTTLRGWHDPLNLRLAHSCRDAGLDH